MKQEKDSGGTSLTDVWCDTETLVAGGRANAHLIAAAPEMYEALKRLDQYGFTDASWSLVHRALAKAEGK